MVDRFGPQALWAFFGACVGLAQISGYFYVHDASTMVTFFILNSGFNAVLGTVLMPMLYAHLPKDKFGQLVSAQSLVVQTFLFLSTNALGMLIAARGNNYLICFLYGGIFYALIPIFSIGLRRVRTPFVNQPSAMESARTIH